MKYRLTVIHVREAVEKMAKNLGLSVEQEKLILKQVIEVLSNSLSTGYQLPSLN